MSYPIKKSMTYPKAIPELPSGNVAVGGSNISIGTSSVLNTPSASRSKIEKGLQKAYDEDIFSPSPSPDTSETD